MNIPFLDQFCICSTVTHNTIHTMLATKQSATILATRRYFSSTFIKALKDSSKASATLINLSSPSSSSVEGGNSFKSFAEYRKSAIQHGPLKKTLINDVGFKPILTDYKDYGVSDIFAKTARSNDYRE